MPAAARNTDAHTCPKVEPGPTPHVGGPISSACSPDVDIENLPAARAEKSGSDSATCAAGGPDVIIDGSPNVIVNNLSAVRVGDMTKHGGIIIKGAATVVIGVPGDAIRFQKMEVATSTQPGNDGKKQKGHKDSKDKKPPKNSVADGTESEKALCTLVSVVARCSHDDNPGVDTTSSSLTSSGQMRVCGEQGHDEVTVTALWKGEPCVIHAPLAIKVEGGDNDLGESLTHVSGVSGTGAQLTFRAKSAVDVSDPLQWLWVSTMQDIEPTSYYVRVNSCSSECLAQLTVQSIPNLSFAASIKWKCGSSDRTYSTPPNYKNNVHTYNIPETTDTTESPGVEVKASAAANNRKFDVGGRLTSSVSKTIHVLDRASQFGVYTLDVFRAATNGSLSFDYPSISLEYEAHNRETNGNVEAEGAISGSLNILSATCSTDVLTWMLNTSPVGRLINEFRKHAKNNLTAEIILSITGSIQVPVSLKFFALRGSSGSAALQGGVEISIAGKFEVSADFWIVEFKAGVGVSAKSGITATGGLEADAEGVFVALGLSFDGMTATYVAYAGVGHETKEEPPPDGMIPGIKPGGDAELSEGSTYTVFHPAVMAESRRKLW